MRNRERLILFLRYFLKILKSYLWFWESVTDMSREF